MGYVRRPCPAPAPLSPDPITAKAGFTAGPGGCAVEIGDPH